MNFLSNSFKYLVFWKALIFLGIFFTPITSQAQNVTDSSKIYNVNRYWSAALGGAGILISQEMIRRMGGAEDIPKEEILALDKYDVNSFDRIALEQDNIEYRHEAHRISDYVLIGSVLLPITLFIDKKIRKHWLDVSLMYLESQALTANLYVLAGPTLIERFRPVTYYNSEIDMNELIPGRNKHSWFSGQTANTATGTFFWAKVLTDFHPEWKGKWKIWAAAAVPPAYVGYLRYRALKHFPTDIIMGFIVGGGSGILIPHLHKKKELKRFNMSLYYNDEDIGFTARWVLN